MITKVIKLKNNRVEYTLKKSRRSKCLRVAITADASIVVTKPFLIPNFLVESFLKQKAEWILKTIEKVGQRKSSFYMPRRHKVAYKKYKEEARSLVKEALEKYNKIYNFSYDTVRIKNHKSRWGSCSENKNLNLCYRLVFMPKKMAEYIVVHELCHLGEMNHSKRFWQLVAQTFPDYKKIEKELKKVF